MSNPGIGVIVAGAIGASGIFGRGQRPARSIGPIIANVTVSEDHHDDLEITDHPVEQGASISDHAFKRPAELRVIVGWSNSPSTPAGLFNSVSNAFVDAVTGAVLNAQTTAAYKVIGGSALGNLAVGKLSDLLGAGAVAGAAQINNGTGAGTSVINDIYQQLLKLQTSAEPFNIYTGKRVYKNMLIRTISTSTDRTSENALIITLSCRQVILVQTTVVSITSSPDAQSNPEKTASVQDSGVKQVVPVDATGNPKLADSMALTFPVDDARARVPAIH